MSKLGLAEPVEPRNDSLQLSVLGLPFGRCGGMHQRLSERGQAPERATVTIDHRNTEPGDQRYGDVGVDAEPNQVVRDEAVEERTEDVLRIEWKRRLQAEQRVRGDGVRGDNSGDEGQAIGGTGNVAVGQTGTPWDPNDGVSTQLIPAPLDRGAERLDLFALEHRPPGSVPIERCKTVAVVSRIEFTAESHLPAFLQCRNARADSLEHLEIHR